jgi:HlyD family secretion protein
MTTRLVPWKRDPSHNFRAGRLRWRRCCFTHAHARPSRLASRAPRSGTRARAHPSRGLALGLAAFVALAAGCSAETPENELRVSGFVEATEVQIASDVGGRILELRVAEGDRLNSGDLVARIDARDTELQIDRLRAERAGADAQLRLLRAGSRSQDIGQAEAQLRASEADVTTVAAELNAAQIDLDRFESLLQANAGSRKQRDDAKARVDVARERQRAAAERVGAARETLERLRAGARPEEIDAARARVEAVDAQIASLQKTVSDAGVISPATGIVTQKLVDAGELIARGTPIVVVTDLDNAWANLFVPEPMIPRIKLGQAATIRTDAGGDGLPGKITFVSPRAEFTPRNVQTADERSKLVYRIKVAVDNRAGVLKQGMPVDAELALP